MTPDSEEYQAYQEVEAKEQPTTLYEDSGSGIEKGSQHYQFKGRFIVTSVKSGLMIIDQQRAHIRVLYDKYLEQLKARQGVSQGVLFPEILQLPLSESVILQNIMDDLSKSHLFP